MMSIMAIIWFPAHFGGSGGWHAQDVLTAAFVFIAVVGLTLIAAGRRVRMQRAQEVASPPAPSGNEGVVLVQRRPN